MESRLKDNILINKAILSKRINKDVLKPFLEKHKIFTKSMLKDIYDLNCDCDLFVELTTRGPDACAKFLQVLKEAGYNDEVKFILDLSGTPSKRLCYKMNSKPLGFCLIINNVNFDHHKYRYGSDVDAEALKHLFETLDYKVRPERNLKAKEMRNILQQFKEQKEWSTVDSCVVIILSHGDNAKNVDIIYGSDSEYITKIEIYELFDNQNELLQNKPKMFFFQACRGEDEDDGVYMNVSSDAAKKVKIPSMSNMIVAHSSLPYHISYRDHEKGSWFGQDLVEVFSRDYLTQDLETMLKTVDLKLESRLSHERKKQVLHVDKFGVKADVYFCMDNVPYYYEVWQPKITYT